jgi:DNA replication protein DnaC
MPGGGVTVTDMAYDFEGLSYAEALKIADEGETWIVVRTSSPRQPLLYGEAKSGKSFLVCALIKSLATGTDFLGVHVPQERAFSVAVCWTDDRSQKGHRIRGR